MTVSGLETQQFPQTVSSVTQEDRQVTGVRSSHLIKRGSGTLSFRSSDVKKQYVPEFPLSL